MLNTSTVTVQFHNSTSVVRRIQRIVSLLSPYTMQCFIQDFVLWTSRRRLENAFALPSLCSISCPSTIQLQVWGALPQRIQAESSRWTHLGAFSGKIRTHFTARILQECAALKFYNLTHWRGSSVRD